jgi:17beta-estradiol 17-dehydrogenase / very-long-chain 3-oxoacyl-CoA reductase
MGLDPKEKNLIKFLGTWVLGSAPLLYFVYTTYFTNDPIGMVGFLSLAYFIGYRFIAKPLYLKVMTTLFPKKLTNYGAWAIVTGGTSGIGEAFIHKLAGQGLNILNISRTESKLKKVAEDVKSAFPDVKTDYMVYDFGTDDSKVSSQFYDDLRAKVDTLPGGVGMLINNVGGSNDDPELLHVIPQADVEQMLKVNNAGTIMMSRAILPHMMARKSGAIICISSASCTHPTPMLSCYSATKAFGNQLTRSMHYEYKEFGIDCLSLTPYYFVSNMFRRGRATYLAPFPQAIIDAALPLLGYQAEAYPYWCHWFMGCIAAAYYSPGDGLLGIMKRNKARADAKAAERAMKAKSS